MKLYSGPLSLFARKAEIALGEKGLAFEREMVPFSQERGYAPKHPAVLAANPKAQVPVLVDGGLTLFDSTVIFEYLEDRYPAPPLYPADPEARARCRMIELFADEVMLPPLSRLMHRTEPPGGDGERAEAAAEAEARIAGLYPWLAERLGDGAFFVGGVSVADIAVFMSTMFAVRLGAPGPDRHPALAAWFRRMHARPVFARVAAEMAEADRILSQPVPPYRWVS